MRSLQPILFIVLAHILLFGCTTDREVIDTSDENNAPDGPRDSESNEFDSVPSDAAAVPPAELDEEPEEEPEEEQMPTFVTPGPLTDRPECDDEATVLFEEIDEVYDLAITDAHLYSATYVGLLRGALDGSQSELLVERFMQRVWADEEHVYFSTGSGELNVFEMGAESTLLPTHGSVEGVSQDETSIFAINDGYLVRVDKATKEVTPLVESDVDMPLHWSGTAVDDEHVYFVTYGNATDPTLERIRKDGTDREEVASAITEVMRPVSLLVDEHHVYIVGDATIARVEVTGGSLTPVVAAQGSLGFPLPTAQDEACLYYSTADAVICYSKTSGTHQRVLDHRASALATYGGDLYVGVSNTGPAFAPNGFVGRVGCGK